MDKLGGAFTENPSRPVSINFGKRKEREAGRQGGGEEGNVGRRGEDTKG